MTNLPGARPPDIDLRALLAALRRQRRVLLVSIVGGLAATVLALFALAPRYTATALIEVDPSPKDLLSATRPQAPNSGSESARVDSEVEILRSDALARAVIERLDLLSDDEFRPRRSLTQALLQAVGSAQAGAGTDRPLAQTLRRFHAAQDIRRRGLTYLIAVSMTSRSPERAAELANTLADAYLAAQVRAKSAEAIAARDLLRQQIEAAREQIAVNESAIRQFLANGGDAVAGDEAPEEAAAVAGKRLLRNEAERLLEQSDWKALSRALHDKTLAALVQARQQAAREGAGPDLQATLSEIDARLRARSMQVLAGLEREIDTLSQAATAQEAPKPVAADQPLPPETLASVYAMQQATAATRQQFQVLSSRLREVEAQVRLQLADSRVVSPALAPAVPSFPNRGVFLLAGFAASAGIGTGLAFLREHYLGGITTPEQLSDVARAANVVSLPASFQSAAASGGSGLADRVIDAPLSSYSEAVRTLRAAIDLAPPDATADDDKRNARVVMVTSALPGEGKTTTALALARTYALSGKATLLIDADLRMPAVHRHVGVEPDSGFVDFLRNPGGTEESPRFFARDPGSTLSLILGAGIAEIPTDQLLASPVFESLIAYAREIYDLIVIDTPPLLPVVDGRYVALHADNVVLCTRWASTPQGDVRRAAEQVQMSMRRDTGLIAVLVGVGESRGGLFGGRSDYSGRYTYSAAT